MLAVRYGLMLALPILTAAVLFYASQPLEIEAHRLSTEFLNRALSADQALSSSAFDSLSSGELRQLSRRLHQLAVASILVAGAISAYFVPPATSSTQKLNLLTTMLFGLAAGKILFGFYWMDWPEFGAWAAASFGVAGCITWLRRAAMAPNRAAQEK